MTLLELYEKLCKKEIVLRDMDFEPVGLCWAIMVYTNHLSEFHDLFKPVGESLLANEGEMTPELETLSFTIRSL